MTTEKSVNTNVMQFAEHLATALRDLRGALADLLAAVGADPSNPQNMARRFGLNKNLTWKISRIVCEPDPVSIIPHIPGRPGVEIFVKAMQSAGASQEVIAALQNAVAEFERMVETHAGDRTTLEMMLGGLTRNGDQQRAEAHRRLAFQGSSAIWGIQARVQMTTNIIAPSDTWDKVDLAWLSGLVDLRRLRPDVPWAVASAKKFETDGTELSVGAIQAIDPDFAGTGQVPLMGDFCSQPLPEIRAVAVSEGTLRYELVEGPVGNTAATTCIVGLFGRAFITRYRYGTNTLGEHIARLNTPVEILVHDLFVHEDLAYALSPRIRLYSQLPGGPVYPAGGRDAGQLPVHEDLVDLGSGLNGVLTPEFPQYKQMMLSVHERLGWNPNQFRGFRFRMRYPPIPALAVVRYDLPERPAEPA